MKSQGHHSNIQKHQTKLIKVTKYSDLQNFASVLQQKLLGSLPGPAAHLIMIPPTRLETLRNLVPDKNAKLSAVLILLYPRSGTLDLILIKRARYNGVHSGQIALPGGQHEPSDKSMKHTALREAQEEIGIDAKKVRILGKLSPVYIPPSNFKVFPYVGLYLETPDFKVDGIETTDIIEVRFTDFINPANQTEKTILSRDGKKVKVPCFYLNGEIVWGATAMMLSELFILLHNVKE